jgi:hypothetical protein
VTRRRPGLMAVTRDVDPYPSSRGFAGLGVAQWARCDVISVSVWFTARACSPPKAQIKIASGAPHLRVDSHTLLSSFNIFCIGNNGRKLTSVRADLPLPSRHRSLLKKIMRCTSPPASLSTAAVPILSISILHLPSPLHPLSPLASVGRRVWLGG